MQYLREQHFVQHDVRCISLFQCTMDKGAGRVEKYSTGFSQHTVTNWLESSGGCCTAQKLCSDLSHRSIYWFKRDSGCCILHRLLCGEHHGGWPCWNPYKAGSFFSLLESVGIFVKGSSIEARWLEAGY